MEGAEATVKNQAAEEALLPQDDPETAYLEMLRNQKRSSGDVSPTISSPMAAAAAATVGFEWEAYKENVRPLKRGRKVQLLNQALRSRTDSSLNQSLLQTRRRMIEAINEYQGDDPLQPWIDCIKWVQEAFPTAGESSGLVVIYEQCVRNFWQDERYQDDLRYLKVWLEYADNCADAEVIFSFLETNEIGQSHSIYYISFGLLLESKNKLRKADDIYNLGIARKAKPLEKLEAAYRSFLIRSTKRKVANLDEPINDSLPVRTFGNNITSEEARGHSADIPDLAKRKLKLQRNDNNKPLSVYRDTVSLSSRHLPNNKGNEKSWKTLGTQSERNKENTSIPTKWTSYKVPQKIGGRTDNSISSSCIEVYVDEELPELPSAKNSKNSRAPLKLKLATSQTLKKETEMLTEDPLRNFPLRGLR